MQCTAAHINNQQGEVHSSSSNSITQHLQQDAYPVQLCVAVSGYTLGMMLA
jgi:hypothetical protein